MVKITGHLIMSPGRFRKNFGNLNHCIINADGKIHGDIGIIKMINTSGTDHLTGNIAGK